MVWLPQNKSKHIDWTQGLKCDHRVWPWSWIFKVKYGISYISAKNGLIAMKWKANIAIELKASNVTIMFDLGHDLHLEFSMSNMEFAISQPKVVWLPRNEKETYRLNSRPQMWPMGLTLSFEFSRSSVTLTFDHMHVLEQGLSWSNFKIAVPQNGRPINNKVGGSRSFMTMTMTIWWPRSGVRIYQIVTGVTSDVGVPLTLSCSICYSDWPCCEPEPNW